MNNQLACDRIRMLMSGMFEDLSNVTRMPDIWFDKKTIRYRGESEIRAMRGGVILIKEPAAEWITEKKLVDMCFGC